jgi:hypothetical protein
MGVPTLILARTDAEAANLITSDYDENDKPFLTGERTQEGFYRVKNGLEQSISRGVAYAPYADLVWCETGVPDIGFAREFAQAVQASPARASCCPTTARRPSTGRRTSTTRRSLPSRKNCRRWATSTSSSPWPASTSTGITPSSSPMLTPAAKA